MHSQREMVGMLVDTGDYMVQIPGSQGGGIGFRKEYDSASGAPWYTFTYQDGSNIFRNVPQFEGHVFLNWMELYSLLNNPQRSIFGCRVGTFLSV
jgi:hypothetical protein